METVTKSAFAAKAVAIVFSDLIIHEAGTGKTSLIGCFSRYSPPSYPFATPKTFVTVTLTNIEGNPSEPISIEARVINPLTGERLATSSGQLQLDQAKLERTIREQETVDLSIPIPPFKIDAPVKLSVVFLINGNEIVSRELRAIQPINAE